MSAIQTCTHCKKPARWVVSLSKDVHQPRCGVHSRRARKDLPSWVRPYKAQAVEVAA